MSQAGDIDVIGSNPNIPTTFIADSGSAVPILNTLDFLATSVIASSIPIQTTASGNTVIVEAQLSSAVAATDVTQSGLSHFDSSSFGVDANGFVTLVGGGASNVETLTGNTGGAIAPVANNIDIVTDNTTVVFAGSSGTLTQDFGLSNLMLGSSGSAITSGTTNVCLGLGAGDAIDSGQSNVYVGYNAGLATTTFIGNTGVGFNSLMSATGGGITNTAVGYASLSSLVTGQNNTCIGSAAGSSYSGSETSNICINNYGFVGESYKIRIGITPTGLDPYTTYLAGDLNTYSGRVVKTTGLLTYPYTTKKTDYVILVATSAPRTINLIASPDTGRTYRIKDYVGSASTNNITITPAAGTIDGAASYVIASNYGAIDVIYNGTSWGIH
jgi:hypothetical protein